MSTREDVDARMMAMGDRIRLAIGDEVYAVQYTALALYLMTLIKSDARTTRVGVPESVAALLDPLMLMASEGIAAMEQHGLRASREEQHG
jgi:hypothetical protein